MGTTKFTFDSTVDRPAAMTCFKKPRLQYSSTEKQVGFSWEVQQMFLYPVPRLYQVTSLPMFRAPSVYLLTLLLLISCTLATLLDTLATLTCLAYFYELRVLSGLLCLSSVALLLVLGGLTVRKVVNNKELKNKKMKARV